MNAKAQTSLNILTFNLRYNTPSDSLNAWPYRKNKVASTILFNKVNLFGVQEALIGQMNDLKELLPGFKSVGVGRQDGKDQGEFSAIFYDTLRLELFKSHTFWLAKDSSKPNKGWDAAFERIVTWAEFKDKLTGKTFYHFNTHFDHMGKTARRESAKLLINAVHQTAQNIPAIVTGDFNAMPDDEPIQVITNSSSPNYLIDTKKSSVQKHYGPNGTFNAFKQSEESNEPIDYIFTNHAMTVLRHATLSESWQGRFASDHFPVFAEIIIE